MQSTTEPFELVQLLLMENTSKDEFLDFQKRFQSFIDQSPSFLHSVGKKGFFLSFFFGTFTTLLDSGLADFRDVKVKEICFRFDDHGTLKLAVLTEDSKTKSEKIICIAVSDKENAKLEFDREELANIDSHFFFGRGQDQKVQLRYEKHTKVGYGVTIEKEKKKVACSSIKLDGHVSPGVKEFTLIKRKKENLKDLIEELANKGHGEVINTMKEVLDYITSIYSEYKNNREIKKQFDGKESSYHGFLAGFLMNFKYRYHLKLYLELFAGKGQADVILLVRGIDKSLNAIPIIIELKAKTDEANTPQRAMEQVQGYVKGSFSNFVRMVTLANEVVCVGLNFEMNRVAKYSLYAQEFLDRKDNSVVEKLLSIPQIMVSTTKTVEGQLGSSLKTRAKEINKDAIESQLGKLGKGEEIGEIIKSQLMGLFKENKDKVDKQRLKKLLENLPNICVAQIIRKQLEYLYYGIVWSNGGSDNIHYVSQFILGQLILISDMIKDEKSRKYTFIYNKDGKMVEGSQARPESAEESIADCVTTIVLTVGKKVFILNINEKNKFALRMPDGKRIPIEEIQNINDIKIQEITCNLYSTPSNKNPFNQYCRENEGLTVNTYNSLDEYKRSGEAFQGNFLPPIGQNEKFKVAMKEAIKSGGYGNYKKVFKEISNILYPFKSLINNEATFQALLHGLFSSYSEDNIKVITEFQIGGGEKLDIMLIIKATDRAKEYPPVGIELKFAKVGELNKKEKEAKDQLTRYEKGEAYKVITDADKAKLMYAVFDKGAADKDSLIKIGDKFVDVEVKHSSDMMLPSQQPASNVQQPIAQQAGPSKRAFNR